MRERAEPDCSAAAVAVPAEVVLQRAWLPPSAASLTALARPPLPPPGSASVTTPAPSFFCCGGPTIPGPPSSAECSTPPSSTRRCVCCTCPARTPSIGTPRSFGRFMRPPSSLASRARDYAVRTGDCDAGRGVGVRPARPAGLVWRLCSRSRGCGRLPDRPGFPAKTLQTQRRHWGLDQAALARRLASALAAAGLVATVVGCLRLAARSLARTFRPRPRSVCAACERPSNKRAAGHRTWRMGIVAELAPQVLSATPTDQWPPLGECPGNRPTVRRLLRDLLDYGRGQSPTGRSRAAALPWKRSRSTPSSRLKSRRPPRTADCEAGKLSALAEFAAGAGHEINNPLAVISGQAQYLLAHANDWFPRDSERPSKALHTIIGQTQRIHGILRDLMQFARPAAPRPIWFDLPALLARNGASLGELAEVRGVRIEIGRKPDRLAVFADVEQVRIALACLVRNAIEAAPGGRLGARGRC